MARFRQRRLAAYTRRSAAMNRRAPDASDWYTPHRRRLMDELPRASGDLCVFGAGNCADIDLEYLANRFDEIHLVDLDGAAIERSRDRQPKALRERIQLHGDRDLSGILQHLDDWAERFPSDTELEQESLRAAHALLQSIGRPFDVTLSTCVLSQLMLPFQETWVMNEEEWDKLSACTTAVHLATLFGATRQGGSGFMAFDVVSSDHLPGPTCLPRAFRGRAAGIRRGAGCVRASGFEPCAE